MSDDFVVNHISLSAVGSGQIFILEHWANTNLVDVPELAEARLRKLNKYREVDTLDLSQTGLESSLVSQSMQFERDTRRGNSVQV